MTEFEGTVLSFRNSNVSSIAELAIANVTTAIKMEHTHIDLITNSEFHNCSQSALVVENSRMTLEGNLFEQNQAQQGAAINLACDLQMGSEG